MAAPILKFQNVVVNIVSTTTQVFFPDLPNLRNARVVAIETHSINILPICSDLNTPNVPVTTFNNAFLTLVVADVNNITRMPLQNLQTIFDNRQAAGVEGRAQLNPRDMQTLNIYFNKSYIEYPNAVVPPVGTGFNFGVYYFDAVK
jgi:hypothetical protein